MFDSNKLCVPKISANLINFYPLKFFQPFRNNSLPNLGSVTDAGAYSFGKVFLRKKKKESGLKLSTVFAISSRQNHSTYHHKNTHPYNALINKNETEVQKNGEPDITSDFSLITVG